MIAIILNLHHLHHLLHHLHHAQVVMLYLSLWGLVLRAQRGHLVPGFHVTTVPLENTAQWLVQLLVRTVRPVSGRVKLVRALRALVQIVLLESLFQAKPAKHARIVQKGNSTLR